MDAVKAQPGSRFQFPANAVGVTGVDHVAMPVRDVERASAFVAQLLGGAAYLTVGFAPEERARDRALHVFMRVGRTLLQVGYPHDGRSFSDPQSTSGWPHWAFRVSAGDLDRMCGRLEAARVPFFGPVRHADSGSVSVYLQDAEGNKLELTTYEPYSAAQGTEGGRTVPDWTRLVHQWRPDEAGPRPGYERYENVIPGGDSRFLDINNPYGIEGIDHSALPVHNPERSLAFLRRFFGAVVFHTVGYGEGGRAAGATRHIFTHIGDTLIQVGYPHDGRTFADPASKSGWPHWAFGIPGPVMDELCLALRSEGVPVFGPVGHPEIGAVSAYFRDPDANKMEITTYDPYPAERLVGGQGGRTVPDWTTLVHDWGADLGQGR